MTRRKVPTKRARSPDEEETRSVKKGKKGGASKEVASSLVKAAGGTAGNLKAGGTGARKSSKVTAGRGKAPILSDSEEEASSDSELEEDASPDLSWGPEPELTGGFDLYPMSLPSLNEVYKPEDSDTVNPEALYRAITALQAKGDRIARVNIADDGTVGEFRSWTLRDPNGEWPFQIVANDVDTTDESVELDAGIFYGEYGRPADAWNGKGFTARLDLESELPGIRGSGGEIEMRPLWRKKVNDQVLEIFEGNYLFNVQYCMRFPKRGEEDGTTVEASFWAVRARK